MSWTEERVAMLRELWVKGLSASDIARQIGGVSRNAVIGKASRLGLDPRPNPIKRGDGTSRRRNRALSVAEAERILSAPVLAFDAPVEPEPVHHEPEPDAYGRQGCWWPLWTEKVDHRYCRAPREPNQPYCAEHCQRAYNRKGEAEEAA